MVSNIQIFLGTIAPIFSAIAMSLKLRKDAIMRIVILIGFLQEDIKYYSRPKIKLLIRI